MLSQSELYYVPENIYDNSIHIRTNHLTRSQLLVHVGGIRPHLAMIPKGSCDSLAPCRSCPTTGAAEDEVSVPRLAVGMLAQSTGDGSPLTMRHTRKSLEYDHSRAMATGEGAIMFRLAWLSPS